MKTFDPSRARSRRDTGIARGRLIAIVAVAVVIVVGIVVFIATRPDPPPSEKPPGRDPAELARLAREAKIAKIVEEVEALEAAEEFEKALSRLDEAVKLDPAHSRIVPVKARLEKTVRQLNQWRTAFKRTETTLAAAEGKDTVAAWQIVIDACESAGNIAPTGTLGQKSQETLSLALQRRDWAAAKEHAKKGDLDQALALIEKALDARAAPPGLAAFKESLEKKKRKIAFDRAAIAARNETEPKKAIELWRQARKLAEEPKDVEEVKLKIDALLPLVDVTVRNQRFDAAVKRAEAALAKDDLDEAEKSYREARKLKGGDLKVSQGLRRVAAAQKKKAYEAAMAKGRGLEEKSDWYGAVQAYKGALRFKSRDRAATARLKEIEATHRPSRIEVVLNAANKVKLEFVLVEPGKFRMGDPKGGSDETPHEVTVTKDFWIMTTEVTKRQWEALVPAKTPVSLGDANLPAESVTWGAVQEFLETLNSRGILGERTAGLPAEAEWEYACRAGAKTRWHFGNTASRLGEYGWFERNSDRRLHPVKGRKPNAWGLYDMYGNVAEWCEDWYGRYGGPASDPAGPKKGDSRCVRGGSWNDRAAACRSAVRQQARPERSSMSIGFRIVLR